jgi:hypothetical protein
MRTTLVELRATCARMRTTLDESRPTLRRLSATYAESVLQIRVAMGNRRLVARNSRQVVGD